MKTSTPIIPLSRLLHLLPPELLHRLSVQYKVDAVNQIRLSGETVFTCLLNCVINHRVVTQRLLEETFSQLTGKTADHSSFGKRLAVIKPDFFQAIFEDVYNKVEPQLKTKNLPEAIRLRRVDATTVTLSAKLLNFGICGSSGSPKGKDHSKRHIKAVIELDEAGLPQLLRLCRDQKEANDNNAIGNTIKEHTNPGDLWVFDRGLYDRNRFVKIQEAGGYFITPHHGQKLRSLRTLYEAPDAQALKEQAQKNIEQAGSLKKYKELHQESPFILQLVEEAVFENNADAESAKRRAKWGAMPVLVYHCVLYNWRKGEWEPFVLLSNLPVSEDGCSAGPFSFEEVCELYRLRWAIEVLFKFIKQNLSYSHLLSRNENGIRVMILMALIAAVLLIWYQRETGIDRGWRSVKFWFAEAVRAWTEQLLRQAIGQAVGQAVGQAIR